MPGSEPFLYESIADSITQLIDVGTLQPGDRLPSVRQLSRKRGISIATVLQAYRVLEDKRLVEARPQSGYYVRPQLRNRPSEPSRTHPSMVPTEVDISRMAEEVMIAATNPDLVPLGAAIPSPDLLPTAKLNRVLASVARNGDGDMSRYIVPLGYEPLRTAIARRSLEWGCALSKDDIVITSGCGEALALCLRAVAKPGDAIVVESPTYFGILQLIESLGLRTVEVSTCPREGIDIGGLEESLKCGCVAAVLVTPNFHNPLGTRMPDAKKKELVKRMARRGIPIIEDDIYGDLYFDPPRPRSLKAFDETDTVVSCSSFSKTLSPGYRIGWAVPGRFKGEVVHLKLASSIASTAPVQIAIAEFLDGSGYERHLRTMRREFRSNLERMTQAVSEHFPEGTKVTRPKGGFVLWVEMPDGTSSAALFREAAARGISVAPGPIFTAAHDCDHCLRLNAGYPWSSEIEEAVAVLGRLADSSKTSASLSSSDGKNRPQ